MYDANLNEMFVIERLNATTTLECTMSAVCNEDRY